MKRIADYLLFYCVLLPLSLLPIWFIYLIASITAFILQYVIKYRAKIIDDNLKNSFPELSIKEIKQIKTKFYKHLADIFLEAFKMLSISRKNLMRRYKCNNPEILKPYYDKGQSIILVSAHYNNWEYMVLSLDMQFFHHGIGVGKRMTNKSFGDLMHHKRTRYGTEVCYTDNVKEIIAKHENDKTPCAYMLLSDQSPNDSHKCYWTEFLHQDTPVIYGAEYLSKKYNYPVFYYKVNKVKRGYYTFDIIPISDNPNETEYGEITTKHLFQLEKAIKANPPYWLWSHRRWKHKRPENIYQDKFIKE
ncbi:MAG: lysophospholipid acyltransferase family protein [Bacteroidales bacterium]|jgi:KDO2-lipid IV(A) lauroyltransferase